MGRQPIVAEDACLLGWNIRSCDEAVAGQAVNLANYQARKSRQPMQEAIGLDRLKQLSQVTPGDADQWRCPDSC